MKAERIIFVVIVVVLLYFVFSKKKKKGWKPAATSVTGTIMVDKPGRQ